jgi:hypothetical protein
MSAYKRLSVAFFGAALLWSAVAAAAEPGFVSGLNDVPLMPGLTPLGETLVFDKPGGRIAEAVFTGGTGPDAVSRFYADTLPQLGWRAKGGGRFVRETEELALHVTGAGSTTVRLVLQPRR